MLELRRPITRCGWRARKGGDRTTWRREDPHGPGTTFYLGFDALKRVGLRRSDTYGHSTRGIRGYVQSLELTGLSVDFLCTPQGV